MWEQAHGARVSRRWLTRLVCRAQLPALKMEFRKRCQSLEGRDDRLVFFWFVAKDDINTIATIQINREPWIPNSIIKDRTSLSIQLVCWTATGNSRQKFDTKDCDWFAGSFEIVVLFRRDDVRRRLIRRGLLLLVWVLYRLLVKLRLDIRLQTLQFFYQVRYRWNPLSYGSKLPKQSEVL